MTRAQRERLLLGHERWVWSVVRQCCRSHWPPALLEDLYQEGMLTLWTLLPTYRPEQGSLITYAHRTVRSRILNRAARSLTVVRPHLGGGRRMQLRHVIEPSAFPPGLMTDVRTDLDAARRETAARAWAVVGALPAREQHILLSRLSGQTSRQLGREFGISRQRVSQLYLRATRKIREVAGC